MNIKETLFYDEFENVVYFKDFGDECLVGIDLKGRAVYSFEKMIDHLINQGMSDIDAIEWIEYNTMRSIPYIDNQTNGRAPIIMYSSAWLGI